MTFSYASPPTGGWNKGGAGEGGEEVSLSTTPMYSTVLLVCVIRSTVWHCGQIVVTIVCVCSQKNIYMSNYKEKEVIPNAGLLIVCLAVDSRLFCAVFAIVDVGSDRTGYIQW